MWPVVSDPIHEVNRKVQLSLAPLGLEIVLAVAGLIVGAVIVYSAPRLVAYRLPDPIPFPGARVLLPIAGLWLERWRLRSSLAVELGTAVIFIGLGLRYGSSVKLIVACVYSSLLVAIAYIDLDHRLVLNRLSYPGTILALGGGLLWHGIGLSGAALGAAVGAVAFGALQILGRGALGTGDTKLALLIGAMRGFPGVANALLLGTILGGLGAAFSLLVLRRGRKEYIAYAPYLSLGAIISLLFLSPT